MIVETHQINCRKISPISKYSVSIVGTRQINLIFMSKQFSVTLTSESVTSGQAGGVFRQLFYSVVFRSARKSMTSKFGAASWEEVSYLTF
jgi:hypothetical protein